MSKNRQIGKLVRAIVMVAIYVGMSIIIVHTSLFENFFAKSPQMRYGMGAVFLIYGLFRGYRIWRTL